MYCPLFLVSPYSALSVDDTLQSVDLSTNTVAYGVLEHHLVTIKVTVLEGEGLGPTGRRTSPRQENSGSS